MKFSRKSAGAAFPKLGALLVLLAGCNSRPQNAPAESAAPPAQASVAEPAPDNSPLSAANTSLKAGALDDAAARLFNLRAAGRQFTQSEAAEYRRVLDEVYTRALEAAEKGNPRAEAALKIIRAAAAAR